MENNVNKAFGQRVAELRKKAGFSQEKFAFQCNIDRTYIGTIERGEKSPTLNTIQKIHTHRSITFAGRNHKNQLFSRSSLKTADFSFAIPADIRSIPLQTRSSDCSLFAPQLFCNHCYCNSRCKRKTEHHVTLHPISCTEI